MQIIPLPIQPPSTATVTPQAVAQTLAQVQALASAPLTHRAVTPSDKSSRDNKARSNKERTEGGDDPKPTPPDSQRGHFVNTSA